MRGRHSQRGWLARISWVGDARPNVAQQLLRIIEGPQGITNHRRGIKVPDASIDSEHHSIANYNVNARFYCAALDGDELSSACRSCSLQSPRLLGGPSGAQRQWGRRATGSSLQSCVNESSPEIGMSIGPGEPFRRAWVGLAVPRGGPSIDPCYEPPVARAG